MKTNIGNVSLSTIRKNLYLNFYLFPWLNTGYIISENPKDFQYLLYGFFSVAKTSILPLTAV